MHKPRLTTLADSIFAIAMTLTAFDIKVPAAAEVLGNKQLFEHIIMLTPLFASYILSFSVLATYWMAHHVILSVFAKNIDRKLTHLNVPFLMAVTLLPFSSRLLGAYSTTQVAITFYALNIIILALFLVLMFKYVLASKTIKNPPAMYPGEVRFIYIRILVPLVCGVLAIGLSAVKPIYSIYFLVFAVIFNLIPGGVHFISDMIKKVHVRPEEPKGRTRRVTVR